MTARDKRVAWLLNHTSLREAELPLIRNLGFEVYTSKLLPDTSNRDFRNQSADYEDDQLSTLPPDVLAILNACRWYGQPISPEAMSLLNAHFGTVICSQHPVVLRNVLQHFKGRILLRAFGFPGPLSYGEYYSRREHRDILEGILKVKDRFWFTPFYESVARFEQDVFGERAKVLPIGLPPRVWKPDASGQVMILASFLYARRSKPILIIMARSIRLSKPILVICHIQLSVIKKFRFQTSM